MRTLKIMPRYFERFHGIILYLSMIADGILWEGLCFSKIHSLALVGAGVDKNV